MSGSAVPDTAGWLFTTLGILLLLLLFPLLKAGAMDCVLLQHRELRNFTHMQILTKLVPPSPVSTDHIPIDVSGLNPQPGVSGAGVVVVGQLPDDESVDVRVKVEPISESTSSPPRSRSKHRGVRSDTSLWDRPVDDFLSSESESDDDIEDYIPPIPYGAFKDWEIVRCPLRNTYYHVYYQENRRHKNFFYLKELLPHVYREDLLLLRRRMNRYFRLNPDVDVGLDLWRDVNLLCQSLHSDDVEEFWRTQDDWVVSTWKLYPKSSVHDVASQAHSSTSIFVRDVVVAGSVIQTIQDGLRESYECLASAPMPSLTNVLEQRVASQEGYGFVKSFFKSVDVLQVTLKTGWLLLPLFFDEKWLKLTWSSNPPWDLPFLGAKGLTRPEQNGYVKYWRVELVLRFDPWNLLLLVAKETDYSRVNANWLLLRDVAASFDSAVHRVHAGSFDAAVASLVSAACVAAAAYFVPAALQSSCFEKIYLETWN
ncbi:hypothetical protein Tco_1404490 [Tanacetum coccineum]